MKALLRLGPFLRRYWRMALLSVLCLLLLTAADLAFPAILSQVIDVGLAGEDVRFLALAAGAILAIGIARAVLVYIQRYLTESLSARIGYDFRNQLYDHIQYLTFTFHDHSQAGQLISRCIEDVRSIERFAGTGAADSVRLVFLAVGVTVLLFALQPTLAMIALLPMIPLVWMTTDFGRR
ncbi:MAG: transporter related protein, partial [Chloroflexi bacterium]|nr:transporter related protein [Chloroflexota bacterium]